MGQVQLSTSVRINLLGEDGACSTTSKQDIEDARDEVGSRSNRPELGLSWVD